MAKAPTFEPIIMDLLREHPEGMTATELADAAQCSRQMAHAIVGRGELDQTDPRWLPIEQIGWGGNRARLYGLADETLPRPPTAKRKGKFRKPSGAPPLGATLTVVGLAMDADGDTVVHLRDEHDNEYRM